MITHLMYDNQKAYSVRQLRFQHAPSGRCGCGRLTRCFLTNSAVFLSTQEGSSFQFPLYLGETMRRTSGQWYVGRSYVCHFCGWWYNILWNLTHSLSSLCGARRKAFCNRGATWWKEPGSLSHLWSEHPESPRLWCEQKTSHYCLSHWDFGACYCSVHGWPYPNTMLLKRRNTRML